MENAVAAAAESVTACFGIGGIGVHEPGVLELVHHELLARLLPC